MCVEKKGQKRKRGGIEESKEKKGEPIDLTDERECFIILYNY